MHTRKCRQSETWERASDRNKCNMDDLSVLGNGCTYSFKRSQLKNINNNSSVYKIPSIK